MSSDTNNRQIFTVSELNRTVPQLLLRVLLLCKSNSGLET